jgi:hypothetical protein
MKTSLEELGENENHAILKQMKRASSLKEPIRSTWEDLCFLEEDSIDRLG